MSEVLNSGYSVGYYIGWMVGTMIVWWALGLFGPIHTR
jgi:hypothetical protein